MTRLTVPTRIGAAFIMAPAILALAAGPALAADNIMISNTETVQAHLNADGTVQDARVYEQIALQGNGTVTITNPVSTQKLRNLDSFGKFEVKGGNIVSTQTVTGEKRLRAVSDYDKELPLKVSVTYKLDGKTVAARDVVGKSGRLEVRFKIENVTGTDQEVTYDDGTGKKVTETQKVFIPMVGSLTTVLPSDFTDVQSGEANIAGDGRGQTKMSFTMTLFGPIGSPTSEFGYSAAVSDGMIPISVISALPVSPLDSPSFKGAAASYKGGADTGVTLTAGATEIDANVLKLRDGAQTLIAGLIQLRDGAKKLNTGLAGEAAPGARKLADGAAQLNDGAGKLAAGSGTARDGAGKLAVGSEKLATGAGKLAIGAGTAKAGSGQLAAGSDKLATGAGKLNIGAGALSAGLDQASSKAPALLDGLDQVAAGLELVDGGLAKMYGGIGDLPAKAKPLHEGIQQLLAGLGTKTTSGTLINGVESIRQGLATQAVPGLQQAIDGVYNTSSTAPGAYQKLNCAQKILNDVVMGTLGPPQTAGTPNPCYYDATSNPGALTPVLKGLTDTAGFPAAGMTEMSKSVTAGVQAKLLASLANLADNISPTTPSTSNLVGGLYKIKAGLDTHAPGTYGSTDPGGAGYGLSLVECGLSNATLPGICDPARPGLLQGLALVDGGVSQLVSGVVASVQGGVGVAADVAPAQGTLRGGVHAVMGGIDQIGAGGLTLLEGLDKLNAGAATLKAGTGELAAGADKLAAGVGQLDTGLGKLASGASQLSSGTEQLSDGAGQLDTGLGKLVNGASLLSNGTDKLFAGADKLAKGLGSAATGSGQLADGLVKAVDGGEALPEGAGRLSAEGTSKLVAAGKSTAADYGLKYAVLVAGAERAKTQGMAYGAPAGAAGSTAYSLEISGANGEGGTDVGRGVGALALFGVGSGLVLFRRRLV